MNCFLYCVIIVIERSFIFSVGVLDFNVLGIIWLLFDCFDVLDFEENIF